MFGAVMAAALQQMAKTHQIALDVSRRVLQGITDTSLGCQVDDHLGSFRSKKRMEPISILQSQSLEAPGLTGGNGFDLTQPRLLEAGVVIVVEVV